MGCEAVHKFLPRDSCGASLALIFLCMTKKSVQTISVAESGPWLAVSPGEGASWFAALSLPWWIAGGWALDLFAGLQSRQHKDLDVGILRKDALRVLSHLATWEVFEAKHGMLTRLDAGQQPRVDVFSLWCRPARTHDWALELMLDETDDEQWVYRRQPRIRCPLQAAIRRSPRGIPYLSPEIQLLYKSYRIRTQDRFDFEHIRPKLAPSSRDWLRDSLRLMNPVHPWLPDLAEL